MPRTSRVTGSKLFPGPDRRPPCSRSPTSSLGARPWDGARRGSSSDESARSIPGTPFNRNFQQILSWSVLSLPLWIGGAVADDGARWALWLGGVGLDP